MKYIINFLICFTIFSATAHVSQMPSTIIFAKENGNKVRAFKLPLKMICTFNDGSTRHLILENISNDTLIFKKYYNQENFDCTINSISWIEVRSSQKIFRNTLFVTSVVATLAFSSLAIIGILAPEPDTQGASMDKFAAIFLGISGTLISSIGIIANSSAIPFGFDTNKWKVYVK